MRVITVYRSQGEERMGAQEIWSTTDFPYQCLIDFKRTTNFQAAIQTTVKQGNIVIDAGAGSGILSFFAAESGARKVYAVEIDPFLAACLKRSVKANKLDNVIEVVQGSIHLAELPQNADVLICEMMDTGLMDEMQVNAISTLREKKIITPKTRLIPFQYETYVEFGFTNFNHYGYKIMAPKHDWPHYIEGGNGWLPNTFHACTAPQCVCAVDFRQFIQNRVDTKLTIKAERDGCLNAVRISARTYLANGLVLGATNALNGDKVVPIEELYVSQGQTFQAHVSYQMGGGLASLKMKLSQE